MRERLQKITKRELFYLLCFLLYNFFILIIWKFGSVSILVHQISFAASLMSIFLALFACVYVAIQARRNLEQSRQLQEAFQSISQKLAEIDHVETLVMKQLKHHEKFGEGVQLISQGLKQIKQQEAIPDETVQQIEVLEQKNQALMNHVVGLSDLSMIYHTHEINSIAKVLNTYEIGEWVSLGELMAKLHSEDPAKPDQDLQNMILFYLSHLNLQGFIRSKSNQYTRVKEIPIIERKD